jgi:hypothetical protein
MAEGGSNGTNARVALAIERSASPYGNTDSYGGSMLVSIGSRCIIDEEESAGPGVSNAYVGDWKLEWVASIVIISC